MKKIFDCELTNTRYVTRDENILNYFFEIRRYPLLTIEDERELFFTYKHSKNLNKRMEARDTIINSNQRFVASFAKKRTNGKNFLDIISEANIGLMEAIDKYDPDRNARFINYAVFYMFKRVNLYIQNSDKSVRPKNINLIYSYGSKAKCELEQKLERTPTRDELKEYLEKKYSVGNIKKEDLIDVIVNSIEGEDYEMQIPSNLNDDINYMSNVDEVNKITSLLLNDTEKDVIMHSFGACGNDEETLSEISMRLKKSQKEVEKIYKRAMKKLQSFGNKENLNNNIKN